MLIDIRHEASHNELPALPLLKTAAKQALAWLQTSYWQLQADHLSACRQQTADLLEVVADGHCSLVIGPLLCDCVLTQPPVTWPGLGTCRFSCSTCLLLLASRIAFSFCQHSTDFNNVHLLAFLRENKAAFFTCWLPHSQFPATITLFGSCRNPV